MTDYWIDGPALAGSRLVFLAPSPSPADTSSHLKADKPRHRDLLGCMQRLRGSVYLQDGAIQPEQLLADGRHVVPADARSWHVLWLGASGEVSGCARYEQHRMPVPFQNLGVGQSALARHDHWGLKLRMAVQSLMAAAQDGHLHFAEVGGWAVAESLRFTPVALRIALATFALARTLGGSIGITTATVRHYSAEILRRIGGQRLECQGDSIPRYFDPRYQCQMEILCFDSNEPNPKFRSWIDSLSRQLAQTLAFKPEPCPGGIPHPAVFSCPRSGAPNHASARPLTGTAYTHLG
jgi:hypothetical protein